MAKRIILWVISFCLFTNGFTWAEMKENYIWDDTIETISRIENQVELKLDAVGAILIDEDTGTVLYAKNEHEKLRPASVTKVMTILLIMEALDRGEIHLTDKVPCSSNASKMGGSQIWLNETEELTVDEMLKAICVVSANDCSVAMAEFLAGTEESFVQKMNERAKTLGMNDTTFKNCHGIDEEGHVTSSYDIALMSRELSKNHPSIHAYTTIWMDTLRDGKSELVNTNKLVRYYAGCTGLKTGSTSLAMFNLTATASRNNLNLIAVVMKGSTSQNRFDDAKKLLDYGFSNFTAKVVVEKGKKVGTIPVVKGKKEEIDVIAETELKVLLGKGDEKRLETKMNCLDNIQAPISFLEEIGTLKCLLGEELVGEVRILASENVEAKHVWDYYQEMTSALFYGERAETIDI